MLFFPDIEFKKQEYVRSAESLSVNFNLRADYAKILSRNNVQLQGFVKYKTCAQTI